MCDDSSCGIAVSYNLEFGLKSFAKILRLENFCLGKLAQRGDSDEKAATLPPVQACKLKHGLFYSGGKVLENIQCRPQPFLYFREFTKNNSQAF